MEGVPLSATMQLGEKWPSGKTDLTATCDLVGVSAASDYAYPLDVANLGPKNLTKSAIPVSECQDLICFPLVCGLF